MIDLSRRARAVAPDLLGRLLTSTIADARVTVRIVEVEAYEGAEDPASHAYRGPNARNGVMFGPAGWLYVYRHLGLHHCANIVVGPEGTASAVLLRAAEVVDGVDVAWERRLSSGVCRDARDLARGPARLAVVLGLTREHDGVRIGMADDSQLLSLGERTSPGEIATGPRVGIGRSAGSAATWPWRYWIAGDHHVSASR